MFNLLKIKETPEFPQEYRLSPLSCPVEELPPFRCRAALQRAGYRTLGDIVQAGKQNVFKTKYVGRKSLNELKELCGTLGLKIQESGDLPAGCSYGYATEARK
jgi:DNA-directed RNA polymerase alpha subunit